MILLDTSVIIDLFRGKKNPSTQNFRKVVQQQIPFGITSIIYQEVIQGARNKKEFKTLNDYLSSQRFFHPLDPIKTYSHAASIYFKCREKGITLRSTIDCLIAQIALEQKLHLLHNDRDFDAIASIIDLRIYAP